MSAPAIENVLFILTDQQRADSLGCYGGAADTPHLDQLAEEGTRFSHAYTPTAICTPARTALATGKRPSNTGVTANAGKRWSNRPADAMDESAYTSRLREAGVAVDLVGKSHFGCKPEEMGFTGEHFPGAHQTLDHETYDAYLKERDLPKYDSSALERRIPDPSVGRLDAAVDPRPVEASLPWFLADRTIDRLRDRVEAGTPFCMHTHFFGPHRPYRLPKRYFDRYDPDTITLPDATVKETFAQKPAVHEEQYWYWQLDRVDTDVWRQLIAAYRGFVTLLDHQVGRIVDALAELGVLDRTAIIFSSDHGAFVTRHKMQDKGPAMYEDIYRVPLIIDAPGVDGGDPVEDRLVSLLDLPPTILELFGTDVPGEYDGRSLRGLLAGAGPAEWRSDLLLEFNGLQYAYPQRALRTERYKLVVNPPDGDELYDLERDPDELVNRITDPEYADVRQRLYRRLHRRVAAGEDDFPARTQNTFPGRPPDRRPDLRDDA